MRVVVDMNMSPRWVDALRAEGLEAVHWSHQGNPRSEDDEIMRFAATEGYVVLTRDLDFSAILAATGDLAPSVVHLRREDRFDPALAGKVIAAMRQLEQELSLGAVLSVRGNHMRLRRLPIGRKDFDE